MQKISLLLFLFTITCQAFAFEIQRTTTYTDHDGLSQNTVRSIMQDSKGFMWMGTINGLNRFNGREFVTVKPQPMTTIPLQDNRIAGIKEDSNGYIWVQTFSDMILCYNTRLEKFIDYAPNNKSKFFTNILMASNGDVWLWGTQGVCRVRQYNGKLHSWTPETDDLFKKPINFIFEDSYGKIWFAVDKNLYSITNNKIKVFTSNSPFLNTHQIGDFLYFVSTEQICEFDVNKQKFLSLIRIPDNYFNPNIASCLLNNGLILIATDNAVYGFNTKEKSFMSTDEFFRGKKLKGGRFIHDNKGNIWLNSGSGVLWRYSNNNTFTPIHLIPPSLLPLIGSERYQIFHDSRDLIWISTFGNGLFAFNQNSEQIYHLNANEGLSTNYLLCVTEDSSGEIWVGSELSGVTKITFTNYPFEIFYPNPDGNSDRNNAVRLIYQDSNKRYWIGTRDGYLHICDSVFNPISKHLISGGIPFTIAEDIHGNKWLGSKGGGLWLFDSEGELILNNFLLNSSKNQLSSSNNIITILHDTKERMWITTFGGGLHYVEKTRENDFVFKQIIFPNNQHNMMRGMIHDADGMMWVGTNDGIVIFHPDEIISDNEKYIVLNPTIHNWQTVNSNEVRVIFEDSNKRIWIGTTGGGLNLLVREKNLIESSFRHFNSDNGLSNEMVQSIQEDSKGQIWVSTENGISKFNIETERFENLSFSNNKHATIFNEMSCWKRKNGELMFGSYNGVYIFDPTEITFDTHSPAVIITGLRINGNIVNVNDKNSPLKESITSTKKIVVKHSQNSINLEFSMLNFHSPEFNQYIYYLVGFEKNWNPISRNNIATYRNLPPGNYLFKVKGSNSFGVWSEAETNLQIIINAPWWESWWAITLYLILISSISFIAIRMILKIHRLNTTVQIEKQLTEYKLRFFTNISHEFRTPLTIIRASIENLSKHKDINSNVNIQIKALNKSSIRLLRLVDQLLEFRRLQNNKIELRLEHTETCDFLRDIWNTFKEIAGRMNIDYHFESNRPKHIMLIDQGKIDKIAFNLLSNALKNTPKGGKIMMRLNFSESNDELTVSVSDNGPGIPREKRDLLFVRFSQINYTSDGVGVGLHLSSELARIHKGNISYSESEWGGACFTFSIPLSDKNYQVDELICSTPSIARIEFVNNKVQNETFNQDVNENIIVKPYKDYRLLIVEDDNDVLDYLKEELDKYFTVFTACNGAEGLQKVNYEQPDIVVCDIMMPEMNGYVFTKKMKSNFESSHIPIILLTAHFSEEHRLKGIKSGADAYITKPFSLEYLLARIVKLIELREKLFNKFASVPGISSPSIGFTDRDKVFLERLHNIIVDNIDNQEFKIETFAQSVLMSRTTFFRKIKVLTGNSPLEYLRILRMKKAAELLAETDMNVSEISYKVGINDPFYFSKCFKAQFGKSPSHYRQSN